MKVLLDTSVFVRALIKGAEGHKTAADLLRRASRGTLSIYTSTHTTAELYSVLSGSPLKPPLHPHAVQRLLLESVFNRVKTVSLNQKDYKSVIQRMAELDLSGGAVYDMLQVRAAEKAEVDRLYTFNGRDFRRMPPAPPTELIVL